MVSCADVPHWMTAQRPHGRSGSASRYIARIGSFGSSWSAFLGRALRRTGASGLQLHSPETSCAGRSTERSILSTVPAQQTVHAHSPASARSEPATASPRFKNVLNSIRNTPLLRHGTGPARRERRFTGSRQAQRPPSLQVPRQAGHHHVGPVAHQAVDRRIQRPHAALQLSDEGSPDCNGRWPRRRPLLAEQFSIARS